MTNNIQFVMMVFVALVFTVSAITAIGIWIYIKKIRARNW